MCAVNPKLPSGISSYPYIDNDGGNFLRETFGEYRGAQPSFYSNHPVIFTHESSAPDKLLHFISGALTSGKGIGGTATSLSFLHGQTRLVVYGDPKTGKPSSWTLLEWTGTGKKYPETDTEVYGWRRVSNAKTALSKTGLYESIRAFNKSRNRRF